jgi:hypothetical protein
MTGEQVTPEELAATLEQTATWMATRPAGVTWAGDGLDGTVAGLRDAAKGIRKQLVPAWDALTAERDDFRLAHRNSAAEVARLQELIRELLENTPDDDDTDETEDPS